KQDVMIITGSGTSGLETAAVNIASKGDEVLVFVSGSFGDRFAKICETYEMKTHRIEVDLGENIVIDDVADFLEKNKNIKTEFIKKFESSTGILKPVEKRSNTIQ